MIDPKAAIETIEANRPIILGIKVRIFGRDEDVDHDIGVLQKAREAADATSLPIMLHWTNEPRLLALLRKGDILVHPFNPMAAGPHCLDANGKVYPQILELKERGIYTDFAHGTHLDWTYAEQAAKQGWFPDTISTDLHRRHVPPLGIVFDLVTTMTKFVHLGLPIEEAIRKVTLVPAEVIPFPEKLGTLAAGAVADVSVLDLQLGAFELFDSKREKRIAKQMITSFATVKGGKLVAKSA
jgi:dihydroorotase